MPQSEGGYKGFKIEELFESANGDFDIQKIHLNGKGACVVSSGESNNGIVGKTDVPAQVFSANTITVDMFGNSYYQRQSYKMVTHARVFSLSPTDKICMNEEVGLYMIAKLHFLKRQFSYNNMCSWGKIRQQTIEMPINRYGSIDIAYMESCIHNIKNNHIQELKAYLQCSGLGDCSLTFKEHDTINKIANGTICSKSVKIVDFFDVTNSHNILKSDVVFDSGKTPYVTASEGNNSIVSYIDYKDDMKESGNSIMIGGKTLVITYQPNAFFSNDSHNLVLCAKEQQARKENIQLFLVASLYKSLKPKYNWGDSISKAKIQNDTFVLPITADGSMDYDFMDSYISAVKKQVISGLQEFLKTGKETQS
ncbi:MAG: restriction endonuclease subunit S [Salinivirgaceae bacterium]|nr:restriction endonuclease subunit S [Salinivirgaceae bacterium]